VTTVGTHYFAERCLPGFTADREQAPDMVGRLNEKRVEAARPIDAVACPKMARYTRSPVAPPVQRSL